MRNDDAARDWANGIFFGVEDLMILTMLGERVGGRQAGREEEVFLDLWLLIRNQYNSYYTLCRELSTLFL